MNIYKVWIQIEEIDKERNHYLKLGTPYEAGTFRTEISARRLVVNELMIIRPLNARLHRTCRQVLDSLDVGGEQSQAFAEEIKVLKNALGSVPVIISKCPKCRAGLEKREFQDRDFLDSSAIHVHYICKKCSSRITEEYTLTDVFINDPHI